jgi:hypothetical protein
MEPPDNPRGALLNDLRLAFAELTAINENLARAIAWRESPQSIAAMQRDREGVQARIAELHTRLGNETALDRVRARRDTADVIADAQAVNRRADEALARSRARRAAAAHGQDADSPAWRNPDAAHGNDLQRRAQAFAAPRPDTDLEIAARRLMSFRRPADLEISPHSLRSLRRPSAHRPERAHDPARAALRAWAATAAAEDARDPIPTSIPDGQDCCVCFSRPRTVLFLPCGHAVCCAVCWEQMAGSSFTPQCPCCRTPVDKAERLPPAQLREISAGAEILHADIRHPRGNFIRLAARMP